MAKQNKTNKKREKRRRYRAGQKAERLDMRQGGRVALQRGGSKRREPVEMGRQPIEMQPITEAPIMPAQPTTQPVQQPAQQPVEMGRPVVPTQPIEYSEEELGREININPDFVRMPSGTPRRVPPGGGLLRDKDGNLIDQDGNIIDKDGNIIDNTFSSDTKQQFGIERRERMLRTGQQAEDIAKGIVDIPKAEAQTISREGTIIEDTPQMGEIDKPEAVTAAPVTPETVTQVTDTATTEAPTPFQAAQMEAAQTGSAAVQAAQGQVSEEAELTEEEIAQAANVVDVAPVIGVDVDIPVGALTDRVIGTLSDEAKSTAALNTGSSLRKLSRAKKQLRNAGLTENQIDEIGDDIEALEDRLDDFTETQRGIIAGVDKDTLVDAQMSRLLDGIEEGEIPVWAQGAVGKVENMLAVRGLSASSVGRAELTNAILQSALPMAQSNATALQQAATQQRDIEAKESEANTARRQQTALTNANNVFQMDMAQFTSDQQIALSNSRFLQTIGLTEASNDQQAAVQNAVIQSQINLAEADAITKLTAQNAQAFLQMDVQNLSNRQQSEVLTAQMQQQSLLSNQAALNASRQFNATSQNQTEQFMSSLATQVALNNTQQLNAMKQFNTQSVNAAEARRVGIEADLNKANAAMANQINAQNVQLDFNREQFNAANALAVAQSNVNWRRQANTAETAAANQVNQQNVQNAFQLSAQAQAFLWQELRDQADYDFKWADNEAMREAQAVVAAIGNEAGAAENWSSSVDSIKKIIDGLFGE